MDIVPVNYLAVLACGVVAMVLGYVWYGPLFGKMWMAGIGWTKESMAQMKPGNMAYQYGVQFVFALVMAYVLSHVLVFSSAYMHVSGVSAGLQAGFWPWLGFVVPVTLPSVLWERKSWSYWLITSGYYLVLLCVMGVILSLWM